MATTWKIAVLAALAGAAAAPAQEDFHAYSEPPRLLLNARRLKRLQRERQRQSMRWQQFQALLAGGANMPEPGFAKALYYKLAGDRRAGQEAVAWALRPAAGLRQTAMVFDWCQDLLTPAQSAALAARLETAFRRPARDLGVPDARDLVFAALALAGRAPEESARQLQRVVQEWWRACIVPALEAGREALPRDDDYALFELLHVLRDNLNLDLREAVPKWFQDLPVEHLLCYYPASYPAAENEYRIPAAPTTGEPDLRRAALYRAAELSMVDFDPNAPESQSLQGWLMHDRFLLRSPFGIPYELLWANPYQPGLSYFHTPLVYHSAQRGTLFVRSSWEESAFWLGCFDGHVQTFSSGRVTPIDPRRVTGPFEAGAAVLIVGEKPARIKLEEGQSAFVLGLVPRRTYDVEVDHEELREDRSDAAGILELDLPPAALTGVRVKQHK